ncbi:MAG: SulP family sulfate permease [Gammaproteobacteria bacterium]
MRHFFETSNIAEMDSILIRLFPFISWLRSYNIETLKADFLAGMTGAVIVLPQGVAFATIAGLPPVYGLYTAMVTPIIAALFGSSLHLVSGPTTAISIVVFSLISVHAEPGSAQFVSLAITLTFLVGIYQLAFGLARMGTLVNFVSHTVVIAFTAGAAILIFTSQIKYVLDIYIPKGESFLHTWRDLWLGLTDTNLAALAVGIITLVIAVVMKKVWRQSPNLLVALIVGSLVAMFMGGADSGIKMVEEIPAQLPPLSTPDLSFATLKMLAPAAFAVALLGLIEAVSISRSIASKTNQRIQPSQEFVGQGLSNIVGSFFSSYAGSGSFTRSGVNYAAGAQTPMSAIFAALLLMLIVLLVAPLATYIPIPAMAGVILVVAYNLIDRGQIKHVIRSSRNETAILLVTFLSTLFLDLEFAIYIGVLLSLVFFLAKTATPDVVTLAPDIDDQDNNKNVLVDAARKELPQCPQLKIIRIDMSIYFGSLNYVQSKMAQVVEEQGIRHILIVGTGINFIDLSGEEMLANEAHRLEKLGGGLYFTDLKPSVLKFLEQCHFIEELGNTHFFERKRDAIKFIYTQLSRTKCSECTSQVFVECKAPQATNLLNH